MSSKITRESHVAFTYLQYYNKFNFQTNVIDVPITCPEGQKLDANGKCKVVWTRSAEVDVVSEIHFYFCIRK